MISYELSPWSSLFRLSSDSLQVFADPHWESIEEIIVTKGIMASMFKVVIKDFQKKGPVCSQKVGAAAAG